MIKAPQPLALTTSPSEKIFILPKYTMVATKVRKKLKGLALKDKGKVLDIKFKNSEINWKIMATLNAENSLVLHVIEKDTLLDEGGQAKVYKAHNLRTQQVAAIKVHSPTHAAFDEDVQQERRNLAIVNQLMGIAQEDSTQNEYTLMPFRPGKNLLLTLYEVDENKPKIPKPSMLLDPTRFLAKRKLSVIFKADLIAEIIECVLSYQGYRQGPNKESHRPKLAHRDLKCDNFVLDDSEKFEHRTIKPYLVDSGSAILVEEEKETTLAGTFGYIAPELSYPLDKKTPVYYGIAQDYFSLGICLAEIYSKTNYQAELIKIINNIENISQKQQLTHPQFQTFFPDIYQLPAQMSIDESNLGLIEKEENKLHYAIKLLIQELTEIDHHLRPTPELLRQKLNTFNILLTKAKLSIKYYNLSLIPHDTYDDTLLASPKSRGVIISAIATSSSSPRSARYAKASANTTTTDVYPKYRLEKPSKP